MKPKEKIIRKGQMQNASRNNVNSTCDYNRTKLFVPRNGMKKRERKRKK